jgi:hypothetical protein
LLAYKIRQSVNLLEDLTRNGPFPIAQEVEDYITSLTTDAEWAKNKLDEPFRKGDIDIDIWTPSLLQEIDKIAHSTFQNCGSEIGMREDEYLTALVVYEESVSGAIKKAWPEDIRVAGIIGRLKWHLALRPSGAAMPIITESVYNLLVPTLSQFSNGITEVSNIFTIVWHRSALLPAER